MSIAEGFVNAPMYSTDEVAETIGVSKKVRKLESNEFSGPVAAWANDRARVFGETIIPRHMYIVELPKGRKHMVAWIFHEGFTERNEPFCMHHIACDCSGDIERTQDLEEKQEIIRDCPGLQPALEYQARAVNSALRIEEMLYYNLGYYPKASMEEQKDAVQDFVGASILHLLKIDYEYPRSWIANIESGMALVNLVAKVHMVAPEDVNWLAEQLQEEDEVATDGQVIALSQVTKDSIDAERTRREILRSLEDRWAA
jgi:hypothetical protein